MNEKKVLMYVGLCAVFIVLLTFSWFSSRFDLMQIDHESWSFRQFFLFFSGVVIFFTGVAFVIFLLFAKNKKRSGMIDGHEVIFSFFRQQKSQDKKTIQENYERIFTGKNRLSSRLYWIR